MLGQHHRRWPNITPVLGQRLVFVGLALAATELHETIFPTDRSKEEDLHVLIETDPHYITCADIPGHHETYTRPV